jgi:hypothetical protein
VLTSQSRRLRLSGSGGRTGRVENHLRRGFAMIGAMAHRPPSDEDKAHDVLAAEEFVVPAGDPALHREEPHDVLAAEEFAVPAIDPVLHHHGPVSLPDDPTGIAEPHDVLAAEEFALPAPRPGAQGASPAGRDGLGCGLGRGRGRGRARLMAGGALVLLVALRARKRRS